MSTTLKNECYLSTTTDTGVLAFELFQTLRVLVIPPSHLILQEKQNLHVNKKRT